LRKVLREVIEEVKNFFVKLLRKVYYAQPEHEVHEQQAQQSVQHSGAQQHAVLNRFNNFLKKAFISTPKVSLYYITLY
jgi:hypothetical protein